MAPKRLSVHRFFLEFAFLARFQHGTLTLLPKWMAHEMVPFSVKTKTINHIGDTYDGCASDGALGLEVERVEVLISEGE